MNTIEATESNINTIADILAEAISEKKEKTPETAEADGPEHFKETY